MFCIDGANDFISFPDSDALDMDGNSVTLMAWINPEDCKGTGDALQTIVTKSAGYYLNLRENTCQPQFYWYGLSTEGYHISDVAVKLDSWSHVAAVYDGEADVVRLYVNGELEGTNLINIERTSNNYPVTVGYHNFNGFEYWFDGIIDEVSIWERALTSVEIQQRYQEGLGMSFPASRRRIPISS